MWDFVKTFLVTKGYVSNWTEEVFPIKKVKNTVSWTYLMEDLSGEEVVVTF